MLIAGPQHLRMVLDEYVAHFNRHRSGRARSLRPLDHDDSITALVTHLAAARIRRRQVLCGLIHETNGLYDGHRPCHRAAVRRP